MSLQSLIEGWEGETVVVRHDRLCGAWILIAIHSTRLGPAGGGTRMRPYPDVETALRDACHLAESMTAKFALADFPMGGGKSVIMVPGKLDAGAREELLRRYGRLIHQLGGLFYTGPDIGTSPEDMDVVSETGTPYVFARTERAGGSGGSAAPTARGVYWCIRATLEHLFGDDQLGGQHVAVQGAGGVGSLLIRRLVEEGVRVTAADRDPEALAALEELAGVRTVSPEAIYGVVCDVFSPCATGGVLNARTIPRLRCRAVVGAANNQLATPEDALRLREAGILYAPDYAVNAGGAIAVVGIEAKGWTREQAEDRVRRMAHTLRELYHLAEARGITTEEAARRAVQARLAAARAPD